MASVTRRPCAHVDCDDFTDQGRLCWPCWSSKKDHPARPCGPCARKRKTRPRPPQRSVEAMYDDAYGDDRYRRHYAPLPDPASSPREPRRYSE